MYLKTSKSTCNVPIDRSARTKLHDSKFASSTSLWNIIFISCTTHSGTASSALPGSHPWRATPRQSQVMVSNWTTATKKLLDTWGATKTNSVNCKLMAVHICLKMARSLKWLKCMVATTVIFWPVVSFAWLDQVLEMTSLRPAASLKRWDSLDYFMVSPGVPLASAQMTVQGHDAYVFWRFWRSTKINEQRGGSVSWRKY